jgi:hypothetical protein
MASGRSIDDILFQFYEKPIGVILLDVLHEDLVNLSLHEEYWEIGMPELKEKTYFEKIMIIKEERKHCLEG